jgi:hypothetical protein
MNKLFTLVFVFMLSGCSSLVGMIPSFSDPNQSARIIDVRSDIDALDCSKEQLPQVLKIQQDLRWFELYSQSAGRRHQDVISIIKPLQETVGDMVNRAQTQQGSKVYCEIKKKLMAAQAERAAASILGRF